MSLQVSAAPTSPPKARRNINRQSANYHPTIWGDHFLSYASHHVNNDAATHQREYEKLKQEVKGMLISTTDEYSDKLSLIDAVQRLGVAYHFEKEIEDELEKIYLESDDSNNLNTAALSFRLLRQKGFNVPCADIFGKFKDKHGKFKSSLINDVTGMLSLYEAAHLGIRGEDILDEAIDFTTFHLKSKVTQVSPHLAQHITHALNRPFRKGIPRLETRHYIDFYSVENPENKELLKFAQLDFNMLQAQHQKELSSLTEWWKRLDFATKMPYARDRVVELYFWIMSVYFEPQYTLGRRILTKVIAIASIIDDTYDVYGTLAELEILTGAIKRWDISAIDILPEYMKPLYQALLDIYIEAEEELSKEGRSYCVDYAIEEMKRVVQGYLVEVKWCNEGYVPTMEEYKKISVLVTPGYKMLATTSFLGMGEIAHKQIFDWISNDPEIVVASTTICRLMDDIVSRGLEQKRKHVASAVECYTKQHSVSEEEAIRFFWKEISSAWKVINQEMLKPTAVPMPFLERILNFSRVIDFLYKDDDCYTNSYKVKDEIASVLVNPIPI